MSDEIRKLSLAVMKSDDAEFGVGRVVGPDFAQFALNDFIVNADWCLENGRNKPIPGLAVKAATRLLRVGMTAEFEGESDQATRRAIAAQVEMLYKGSNWVSYWVKSGHHWREMWISAQAPLAELFCDLHVGRLVWPVETPEIMVFAQFLMAVADFEVRQSIDFGDTKMRTDDARFGSFISISVESLPNK